MSGHDEDDVKTVVLDLNALKKQKLLQEEELASIVSELEFNSNDEEPSQAPVSESSNSFGSLDTESFAEKFLGDRKAAPAPAASPAKTQTKPATQKPIKVILFDYQSDFFQQNKAQFPKGFDYVIATTLNDLNTLLKEKSAQIAVFNYDANPKAVNQLTAQIKAKLPHTKTLIIAKAISPEKAVLHAKTASGANGYYQLPISGEKILKELIKIQAEFKKVS